MKEENSIISNYNKNFQSLRTFAGVTIGILALSLLIMSAAFIRYIYKTRVLAYIVSPSGTLVATITEGERPIYEVKNFAAHWFKTTFAHDQYTYEKNLKDSYNYIIKTEGDNIISAFEKANQLNEYIKNGSYTTVDIDSIQIVNGFDPYEVKVYAKRYLVFPNGSRNDMDMSATLKINDTKTRSESNSYGLTISNFTPFQRIK